MPNPRLGGVSYLKLFAIVRARSPRSGGEIPRLQMQNPQVKFSRFLTVLEKEYGPQGWWPRLIRQHVCGTQYEVRHRPGPKSAWLSKTPADQAFEVAIGAILTQNTSWTNVEKALVCLAQKGMMTSNILSKSRLSSIESSVRSSGYYRQKAKKLKLFAKFVEKELGGDLRILLSPFLPSPRLDSLSSRPGWRDLRTQGFLDCARNDKVGDARIKLLKQWGIGPETADTILLYGLNLPIFVIDAYTRRLLVHLTGDASWSKRPYDEIREFCESSIFSGYTLHPTNYVLASAYQESHALIVKWGKEKR